MCGGDNYAGECPHAEAINAMIQDRMKEEEQRDSEGSDSGGGEA